MAKKNTNPDESEEKVLSLEEIDKVIHEPARLMIISLLYVVESTDMLFLKNNIYSKEEKISWGNLSSHISKLEEAGYVEVEKKFKGKKPKTYLSLTDDGRKAFEKYRKKMAQVLGDMT